MSSTDGEKVPRGMDAPLSQPGAQSVGGSSTQEADIEFTPNSDEENHLEPSVASATSNTNTYTARYGEDEAEASTSMIPESTASAPKVIEAELARSDSDLEERIMERLMKSSPVVTEVVAVDEDAVVTSKRAAGDDDEPKRRTRMWLLIGIAALVALVGLGVGLGVGLSGGGGDSGVQPRTVAPTLVADDCFTGEDGSIFCYSEDIPVEGLVTLFSDCPDTDEESVSECERCVIAQTESVFDLTGDTPVCNGCMICGTSNTVAYDCTNIAPNEECAFRDCSGECGKGDPATSTANVQGECIEGADDIFCTQDDVPTTSFVTLYSGCPNPTGLNVFFCDRCVIASEETVGDIDGESELCNSCLVCGDSIAFDCSNFAPDEACAVTTCDGTCVG